jgi:hypothetical protein
MNLFETIDFRRSNLHPAPVGPVLGQNMSSKPESPRKKAMNSHPPSDPLMRDLVSAFRDRNASATVQAYRWLMAAGFDGVFANKTVTNDSLISSHLYENAELLSMSAAKPDLANIYKYLTRENNSLFITAMAGDLDEEQTLDIIWLICINDISLFKRSLI